MRPRRARQRTMHSGADSRRERTREWHVRTTTNMTQRSQPGWKRPQQLELFQLETLTGEASKTSPLPTSPATTNAIFSLASEAGLSRFDKPVGPTIVLSGPDPAHASLSPRQARAAGLMTSGTCGHRSIGSSRSADLQSSLESRLRARTRNLGSTLYKLIWKRWTTPLGPSRFRLQASARPRSETAYTGWPTPRVGNNGGHGNAKRAKQGRLEDVAQTVRRGPTSSGSTAPTDGDALLDPAFTRWLQGYPRVWNDFGVTAMLYAYPLPPSSLPRISIARRLPDTAAARMKRRSRSFM